MICINDDIIRSVMKDKYGKEVVNITSLDGYIDANFKLDIVDGISDKNTGYKTVIMKISSDNVNTLNLQHRIMTYLDENGITTCTPVKTSDGSTTCKVYLHGDTDSEERLCTVLSYLPGITIRSAGHPIYLMEDLGKFAGRVDKLLKKFEQDDLQPFETMWELSGTPKLEALFDKYCEKDIVELGMNIITAFKKKILPVIPSFQKGYIHGDFNDCNFIVLKITTNIDNFTISGLIDYGDACVSFYIYEIATLMADMMSVCQEKLNPVEVGKLILRGYMKEFELNSVELDNLRLIICIRLIQFYVLGAEILEKDPSNQYAGLDRNEYIKMCKYLWNIDDDKFRLDFIEDF